MYEQQKWELRKAGGARTAIRELRPSSWRKPGEPTELT
jgi:hypothetical protein